MLPYNDGQWRRFFEAIGKAHERNRAARQARIEGVVMLHFVMDAQGKLVRVIVGEVFDVAVDLRRSSPTFGRWVGMTLSAENKRMLWIPPGFAHGFLVTSDAAEFLYKTTDYWYPEFERSLLWDDPTVGIDWPLSGAPTLAAKDAAGYPLGEADTFP